jgi:hypothetical protein
MIVFARRIARYGVTPNSGVVSTPTHNSPVMKTIKSSSLVIAAGLFAFLAGSLASLIPFNATTLSIFVGGIASASLLVCAFSDYTRKPRLRLDPPRKVKTPSIAVAPAAPADVAASWTYHTISA